MLCNTTLKTVTLGTLGVETVIKVIWRQVVAEATLHTLVMKQDSVLV